MNYEVSLKERKGILYAHYYEGSKLVKKSLRLKATKPNIAYAQKQIVPNLQSRMAKGEKLFMENKISVFFEKIERRFENKSPATRYTYERGIRNFIEYFGDRDIKSFTVLELDDYVEHLHKRLCASTIRLYLVPIHAMFDEAIRLQILTVNLLKYAIKPKSQRRERRAYSIMQMWQMLDKAEGKLKTFLYIGFLTGMRPGEILALEWSDINFGKKTISISKSKSDRFGLGKTKTRKDRRIPMINRLNSYLCDIEQKDGFIVSYSYMRIYQQLQRLCEELGFFFEGVHNLRHTFASLMLQAKENPLLVKEFLGHTTLTMINTVYAHYIQDKEDCAKFGAVLEQYA